MSQSIEIPGQWHTNEKTGLRVRSFKRVGPSHVREAKRRARFDAWLQKPVKS